jgi:hypothetical protein
LRLERRGCLLCRRRSVSLCRQEAEKARVYAPRAATSSRVYNTSAPDASGSVSERKRRFVSTSRWMNLRRR